MRPAFLPLAPLPRPKRHRHKPATCCATAEASKASEASEASEPSYTLAPGEIAVRFINTPSGVDVVAAALPGDPLLRTSDGVGVNIPRACQSGLCGSCTCDILDTNSETGFQTVRACQTGVVIPDDGTEMIVDVARMKTMRKRDPMKRFENLDTEYVAGAAPRSGWGGEKTCGGCKGKRLLECYNCDGVGQEDGYACALCGGSGHVRCATCQGKGVVHASR